MNLTAIEDSVLRLLQANAVHLPAEEIQQMAELVRAGEPGVGFENLCTRLYEYDVRVDDATLCQLEEIGRRMGIAAKYWDRLKCGE